MAQAISSTATLTVEDLFPAIQPRLTPKAIRALNHKTQNLLYQWNEPSDPRVTLVEFLFKLKLKSAKEALESGKFNWVRQAAPVDFFGFVVYEDEIEAGIDKLCSFINDLAERKYILATLAPFGKLPLYSNPTELKRYVLFSYFCVDPKGTTYVKTTYPSLSFSEGALPNKLEDIK